ncbi:hypothetical protein [Hymenobacter sp. UYP22]|uniref:hypothetical protein n=1 Tax=Hymenobacter sp. UYP22 TaxID=3156348 RepID=UPI003399D89E
MMGWLDAQAVRLWRFGQDTVRPAVPRAAWLLAGVAVFCVLNLVFEDEIWPNHPQTGVWFGATFIGCVVSLPWLAAFTAGRIAATLKNRAWLWAWRLVSWGGYVGAACITVAVGIGLVVLLSGQMTD